MANIEMLGIVKLEEAIAKTDYLDSNIARKDKEPSWDGNVEVYNTAGNVHSKADLAGIARVQVKGHIENNTTKKSITYPVEISDMRNFLTDGGAIFFVIYVSDDGERSKIYYKEFLPYDLRRILDKKGEQITANVNMKSLSTNKVDISNMFKNFIRDKHKQAPAISGDIEGVRTQVANGQLRELSLGYTKINDGTEEDFFEYILNNRVYVYSELPNGISMPIDLIDNPSSIETLEEESICIKGRKYYDEFLRVRKKEGVELCFGKHVRYICNRDEEKAELQFDIKGSLKTRITNLTFVLDVIKENQIEIGDTVITLESPSPKTLAEINLEQQQKYLEYLLKLQEALNIVQARVDLNMDCMDEQDFKNANMLISATINKEKIPVENDGKLFGKITIANISLLMCALKKNGEEDGSYLFSINDLPIEVISKSKDGISEKTSIYLSLDRYAMIKCCNIDYHKMVDEITGLDFSQNISYQANRILLEMLSAYDEKNDEVLLNESIRLAAFIVDKDEHTSKEISLLNYYQAIKRLRPFTEVEEDAIQEIIEKIPSDEAIYVGAYLLLDKQSSAKRHFAAINDNEKDEFKKYPIFRFWEM